MPKVKTDDDLLDHKKQIKHFLRHLVDACRDEEIGDCIRHAENVVRVLNEALGLKRSADDEFPWE